MSLTSDDVRSKQFKLAGLTRKGYDESEVDDFLDAVVAALDETAATIAGLEGKLAAADEELDRHRQTAVAPAAAVAPQADSEVATGLLAMAHRTAEEHVAEAKAQAAETLARARREASQALAAAQSEAEQMVVEAEAHRRQVLGALHYEQQEITKANTALRATTEEARRHLEGYLTDLLAKVAQRAQSELTGELKALPGGLA